MTDAGGSVSLTPSSYRLLPDSFPNNLFSTITAITSTSPDPAGNVLLFLAIQHWELEYYLHPSSNAVSFSRESGAMTLLWISVAELHGKVDRLAADPAHCRVFALSGSNRWLAAFDMDTGAALLGGGSNGAVSFAPPQLSLRTVTHATIDPAGRFVVVAMSPFASNNDEDSTLLPPSL
ncbi:hypothetical protein DFJ73DRAFT_759823 [Zopfochytrium polystomum]|nr:hypothetical protein DFJ73DRAFT_759823 [Zopfochytrium polystomum]